MRTLKKTSVKRRLSLSFLFKTFFCLSCFLILISGITQAQKHDPGSGKTLLLVGQTFQDEYQGYVNGVGTKPAGSSHYGSLYLGAIEQGDDDPNAKFLDWVRTYQNNPYALVALSIKDNTAAGGYGQMISPEWDQFNPNAVHDALVDINAGKWDAEIDKFAQTCAERPDVKFFVRIGYEMSLLLFAYQGEEYVNDWLTAQADQGINVFEDPDTIEQLDRQAYIDAYNRIAVRIRAKADNIAFVYHPVRGFNDTKWLYPGDEYVDYVGFSVFNNDICMEVNGSFNCEGEVVDPQLQLSMDFAKEHGKPLIIAESAVQAPAAGTPSEFTLYLERLHKVVVNNDVRLLAYINSDWPAHGWDANWGDSRVEINNTVLEYWKKTFAGGRYIQGDGVVTPPGGDAPAAPNNLQAFAATDTQITLTWTDNASDETGFYIERATDSGVYTQIASVEADVTSYSSADLAPGTTYTYRVRAYNTYGNSNYTGVATAATTGTGTGNCAGDCPSGYTLFLCGQCWIDENQARTGGCTEVCDNGNDVPSCDNGIQDGDETDIDCGGSCKPCTDTDTNTNTDTDTNTNTDDKINGRFTPENGKTLLAVGQDLEALTGYRNGNLAEPGAAVSYISFYLLTVNDFGINYGALGMDNAGNPTGVDTDWGAGPLNAYSTAAGWENSALILAMSIAENWTQDGLQGIANGQFDANIDKLALFCKTFPNKKIFLRIGYEFDGRWNSQETSGGNFPGGYHKTEEYKAAWRHIVDRMRSLNVNNVAYVWQSSSSPIDDILDSYFSHNSNFAAAHEDISAWYPGDEYVDWIGLSWFLAPQEADDTFGFSDVPGLPNQDDLANEVIDFARAKGKPVMIAEASPQGYDLEISAYDPTPSLVSRVSTGWTYEGAKTLFTEGLAAAKNKFAPGTWLENIPAGVAWDRWFVPYLDYIHKHDDVIRCATYINCNWNEQSKWASPYNEGYWGDSRIEGNPVIKEKWTNETNTGFWLLGGTQINSQLGENNVSPVAAQASEGVEETTFYPVPTTEGQAFIKTSGLKAGMSYEVKDIAGFAVIPRTVVASANEQIDTSFLSIGQYFVTVYDQSGSPRKVQRIIIK